MNAQPESVNRIHIHSKALENNYRALKRLLKDTVSLMAMVKGDGYGHDMIYAARAFASQDCQMFGVAEICEGVELRQAGIAGDIFIMLGVLGEQVEALIHHQLTPVIYDPQIAEKISAVAGLYNITIPVHVKIDTGMGRLGLLPEDAVSFTQFIQTLPGIRIEGFASHFPEADDPQKSSTAESFAKFIEVRNALRNTAPGKLHIANSGAVLNFPQMHCDIVRAGIALYGYSPDGKTTDAIEHGVPLAAAMSFTTRVMQVKEVPAGSGVSYGHTYITERPTKLAVLPVGYDDGYSRRLTNRADVLVHGQRAPVRGRVCMNLCMVDVTDIPGVSTGDEAVLLGRQNNQQISADELAQHAETISYEIVCMLGRNNIRILE